MSEPNGGMSNARRDVADDCHHGSVTFTIVDVEAAKRYEAREDGELAGFLEYVVRLDRIALVHTETLPTHQGRGIGERLVRFALDDARRRDLRVIATCPYVRVFLERHPEFRDNVVGMDPDADDDGQTPAG